MLALAQILSSSSVCARLAFCDRSHFGLPTHSSASNFLVASASLSSPSEVLCLGVRLRMRMPQLIRTVPKAAQAWSATGLECLVLLSTGLECHRPGVPAGLECRVLLGRGTGGCGC